MTMQIDEMLAQARDAMTVRRVFGEPIERDGVTIIPVANVMGGGGGGTGQGPDTPEGRSQGSGSGGGFGLRATPAGLYVIKGGEVRWQPAMDLTRIAITGQIVGVVFLLVVRSVVTSLAKRG